MPPRLSSASQTNHRNRNEARSRHVRQLSYEELKTPGIIDFLVALCAGSKAALLLDRKRTLAYFQSLPDTLPLATPEIWANTVGGEIVGVRDAIPSSRAPWKEPNSGITFRYRHHGTESPNSCSTTRTKFDHHESQPSFGSSTTTVSSPLTPSPHEISNREFVAVREYPPSINHQEKLSVAAALPPINKSRAKMLRSDVTRLENQAELAAIPKMVAHERTRDEDAEDDEAGVSVDNVNKHEDLEKERTRVKPCILTIYGCLDPRGKDTKYAKLAEKEYTECQRPEQQTKTSWYFGSSREVDVQGTYLKENAHVFSNFTKEAAFEAARIQRMDWWRRSNTEQLYGEKAKLPRQTALITIALKRDAQIHTCLVKLKNVRRRFNNQSAFLDAAVHLAAAQNTQTKHIQNHTRRFESKISDGSHQTRIKEVRFSAGHHQNIPEVGVAILEATLDNHVGGNQRQINPSKPNSTRDPDFQNQSIGSQIPTKISNNYLKIDAKQDLCKLGSRQSSYEGRRFALYSEEDVKYFKQYSNTFAGFKNPTEQFVDYQPRRAIHPPEYFLNTRWRMVCRPLLPRGHCKEFILMKNFNPLMFRNTADPREVATKVAAKQKMLLERRRVRAIPPVTVLKRPPLRAGVRYSRPVSFRSVRRSPAQKNVERYEKNEETVQEVEKDLDCAIDESDTDEQMESSEEWDPTCFIERQE